MKYSVNRGMDLIMISTNVLIADYKSSIRRFSMPFDGTAP
jgi:hypothetical protein